MKKIALLLAGGKSTRMKSNKTALVIHGVSLLHFQLEKLSSVFPKENIFISGKANRERSIPDLLEGLGPVEGLRSALYYFLFNQVEFNEVLVVPVDMPLLKKSDLEQLLYFEEYSEAVFFTPFNFPIKLRNSKKLLTLLDQMKEDHHLYSFKNLLKKLNTARITPKDSETLMNTNTREEWNVAISKTDKFKRVR